MKDYGRGKPMAKTKTNTKKATSQNKVMKGIDAMSPVTLGENLGNKITDKFVNMFGPKSK